MNGGSVESTLTVRTESPVGLVEATSPVAVTLEPVSSIGLGKTTKVTLFRFLETDVCWVPDRSYRHRVTSLCDWYRFLSC